MRSIQRFTVPIILIVAAIVTAGQLSPPAGPVAPTMKSLADLSAEHAAIQAAIGSGGGGGGAIKRVIRGTMTFDSGTHEATADIAPPLDPAKSVVLPMTVVYTGTSGSAGTTLHARNGVCAELTEGQLRVFLDAQPSLNRKLAYQIVEYY